MGNQCTQSLQSANKDLYILYTAMLKRNATIEDVGESFNKYLICLRVPAARKDDAGHIRVKTLCLLEPRDARSYTGNI